MPTPDGVPVTTRSPGSRVMVRLMKLTSSATPNTISPGVRVLAQLVVDPAADAEGLRVGHLVGRDQVGAERQEGVDRLAQQPLGGAELERARGHVVGAGVAGDVVEGGGLGHPAGPPADDHGQLGLVVDLLRLRGHEHVGAGTDDRVVVLREQDRLLGELLAGLAGVVAVVEADADDLARPGHRGQQPQLGQRARRAGGHALGAEGQPVGQRRPHRHHRAVLDAPESPLERDQPHGIPPGSAAGVSRPVAWPPAPARAARGRRRRGRPPWPPAPGSRRRPRGWCPAGGSTGSRG